MARAPRDLVVRFVADVQRFVKGTDDVRDALADAGDDSARRLARAYDRAGDQMKRDMRTNTRSVKKQVADTGREAGNEFAANLGESLASGDASRIAQDSVGGLVSSLAFAGPIGAAVAAGGAIALGLWNSFSQTTEAQVQKIREVAGAVYQGMIDEGADFAKRYNQDVVRAFFDPSTEDQITLSARAAADALDLNLGAVLAGGPDSIAAYADEAAGKIDDLQDAAKRGDATGAQREQLELLSQINTYLDLQRLGWEKSTDAVNDYNAALNRAAAYSAKGSSYAAGGSTYKSQLGAAAPYATGTT